MASIRAAQAAGGPKLAGARGSPRRALPLREACGGAAGRGLGPRALDMARDSLTKRVLEP